MSISPWMMDPYKDCHGRACSPGRHSQIRPSYLCPLRPAPDYRRSQWVGAPSRIEAKFALKVLLRRSRPSNIGQIDNTWRDGHLLIDPCRERCAIGQHPQGRCPPVGIIRRPVVGVSCQDVVPPRCRYLVALLAHPVIDESIKSAILSEVSCLQARIPGSGIRVPAARARRKQTQQQPHTQHPPAQSPHCTHHRSLVAQVAAEAGTSRLNCP